MQTCSHNVKKNKEEKKSTVKILQKKKERKVSFLRWFFGKSLKLFFCYLASRVVGWSWCGRGSFCETSIQFEVAWIDFGHLTPTCIQPRKLVEDGKSIWIQLEEKNIWFHSKFCFCRLLNLIKTREKQNLKTMKLFTFSVTRRDSFSLSLARSQTQ